MGTSAETWPEQRPDPRNAEEHSDTRKEIQALTEQVKALRELVFQYASGEKPVGRNEYKRREPITKDAGGNKERNKGEGTKEGQAVQMKTRRPTDSDKTKEQQRQEILNKPSLGQRWSAVKRAPQERKRASKRPKKALHSLSSGGKGNSLYLKGNARTQSRKLNPQEELWLP